MIRALSTSDISQVETLAHESLADGFAFVARFCDAIRRQTVELDAEREYFLGIFHDDVLIAIGGITPDPYVKDPEVGRVRHVYVARDVRCRGIGRTLLCALETRAQPIYSTLRLRTDTTGAAAFYEALGYEAINDPQATHRK